MSKTFSPIRPLLAAVAVLALAAASLAQPAPAAPAAPKKETGAVRLNRAPISNDVIRVHIPRAQKVTLDNGVRVLYLEDHRFPLITAVMALQGAGGLFDPASQPGLASVTAQLMRQGTATRTSRQLAEQIDGLGANVALSSSSGATEASLNASGLSDNFDQWFGIAVDVLLHPSFPQNELDQIKQQRLVGLRQQRANPSFLAQERFAKAVYGDHPAAVVSATEASIKEMTRDSIAAFYREHYAPQNAILVFAGDIRPAELTAKLNKWLAEWKKTGAKVALPPNPAPLTASHLYLVNRPGSVQTNLVLGNLAIDRRDPDYVPLMVANDIFGGSAAARLFMNLREDKGYTYGAYSRVQAGDFRGVVAANSEVRSPVTQGAMTEFFKEFRRIVSEPVPADELQKSRRSTVARFALSLETPASLIGYAMTAERYGFPADYWDRYADQVMAVTAADVQRVARQYFNPDALQIVAVGDAATVKPMLSKWGEIAVYNAEGVLQPAPTGGK